MIPEERLAMTVDQLPVRIVQRASASEVLRPPNLLNDFEELGALLLPELEKAVATSSSQAGPSKVTTKGKVELASSLQESTTHLLDAFFLAVGMNQILEDYLHRDAFALTKVSKNLERLLPDPFADLAAAGARQSAQLFPYMRTLLPEERRLRRQQRAMSMLVQQLANEITHCMHTGTGEMREPAEGYERGLQMVEELLHRARNLLASLRSAPKALRRSVIRLPSCFRSFDQRPLDCYHAVQKFAERWPERDRPIVVIGIRTSGSYLAPLYAAFLGALGYQHAQVLTLRPAQLWLPGERAWLLKQIQPGGQVLLVDDPPNTGSSLVRVIQALEQIGVAQHTIHPVLPVFGLPNLPTLRQGYEAVYLPWEEWAIHSQLAPPAVEEVLGALLSGQTIHVSSSRNALTEVKVAGIRQVERLPLTPGVYSLSTPVTLPTEDLAALRPRGHVRGLYQVQLLDEKSGSWFVHRVYVKGVGLGYFGANSLTLMERLSEFLPEVYGLRDGLLYRAWVPEEKRLSALAPINTGALAERMAAYVATRQRLLALPEDTTERLEGRHPLWQRGNEDVMCHAFGGAAPLVRAVLLGVAKYLMLRPVKQAAVIDGSMAPTEWFMLDAKPDIGEDAAQALLKVGVDDRVFSNQDLDCCDPFYDLASAAAYYELRTGDTTFSDRLRQHYMKLTGKACSDERWLLYQAIVLQLEIGGISNTIRTLQTWSPADSESASLNGYQASDQAIDVSERSASILEAAQRTISRIQERYFGERFLSDITLPSSGPLCAIDLDGVLETGWLGSVATTPAGAMALRMLMRHGYRPVIATGRSLDEVRERSQAYRLAGGIGEYGAVIYNHLTRETQVLLGPEEQATLDALRAVLQRMKGVYVSPAYRYAVRAYQVRKGERRGLTTDTIEQALQHVPGRERLRTIPGQAQTDFMVTTVDKGTGLAALAELLDGQTGHPIGEPLLAFAAGDTASDLAMFRLARYAFAPANADGVVRDPSQVAGGHVHIMKAPFQAGLLQAVSQFLAYDPQRCSTCRPPGFASETSLLLTAFEARDVYGWGKLRQAALLAGRLGLARWSDHRQGGPR